MLWTINYVKNHVKKSKSKKEFYFITNVCNSYLAICHIKADRVKGLRIWQ